MAKPRLMELDIIRAVAISAVLLIHGTANATVELPVGSRSQALYEAINMLSYFPVQLFVLLSGLVLFYRYEDNWTWNTLGQYVRKRLMYIVVPYVVWSVLYDFGYYWLSHRSWEGISFSVFGEKLLTGNANYHLYFMVIILQFYVLFPLFQWVSRLWRPFGRYLWAIGLAVQVAYHLYVYEQQVTVPYGDRLFITYFALFCIGGSIGLYYERFIAWIDRNIWWVTAAATAVGFIGVLLKATNKYGVVALPFSYTVHFYLYPVLVFASCAWIGKRLLERRARWAAALSSMGAASFGIYLFHPVVQRFWHEWVDLPSAIGGYHAAMLGAMAAMFTIPWLTVVLLGRVKGSWILFGSQMSGRKRSVTQLSGEGPSVAG